MLTKLSDEDLKILYNLFKTCTQNGKFNVSKRLKKVREQKFDAKFAYHVVRLLSEVEQIMIEEDIDLERNREQLKSIRRGEWKMEDIEDYFGQKERDLEKVYTESKLRHSPDEAKIKRLLLNCLEMHFGDLGSAVVKPTTVTELLKDLENLIGKYKVNR